MFQMNVLPLLTLQPNGLKVFVCQRYFNLTIFCHSHTVASYSVALDKSHSVHMMQLTVMIDSDTTSCSVCGVATYLQRLSY